MRRYSVRSARLREHAEGSTRRRQSRALVAAPRKSPRSRATRRGRSGHRRTISIGPSQYGRFHGGRRLAAQAAHGILSRSLTRSELSIAAVAVHFKLRRGSGRRVWCGCPEPERHALRRRTRSRSLARGGRDRHARAGTFGLDRRQARGSACPVPRLSSCLSGGDRIRPTTLPQPQRTD
jgi:hypothetical protein